MRTKSQNGRRSRSKGHAWEREVAKILAVVWPKRDVRRCIAQSRTAAREGCDVDGTPWWVECKVGAAPDLVAALRQSEEDSDERPCVVIAKADRRQPVAFLRLCDASALYCGRIPDAYDFDAASPSVTMSLSAFVALLLDVVRHES